MTAAALLTLGGTSNLVTTLYTGTGAARSIVTRQNLTNSLILGKNRSQNTTISIDADPFIFDTIRGVGTFFRNNLATTGSDAQSLTAFNSNGVSLGSAAIVNRPGDNFVLWTMPEKIGFLDIIQGSGNGAASKVYSHNLGIEVGAIVAIRQSGGISFVYHRSLGNTKYLQWSSTASAGTGITAWNNTSPTTTQFTVGSDLNASGSNYMFYVFAHNQLQKIHCGTFTTDGSGNATVSGLAFRPKWLEAKRTDASGDWFILDTTRGWGAGNDPMIRWDNANAEVTGENFGAPTNDGFTVTGAGSTWAANATYVYKTVG